MDAIPIIQFENVSLTLGKKRFFNNLNVTVYSGETFLIFGPYGCGKSLIPRLLMRMVQPDSGIICIKGRNIAKLSDNHLNRLRNSIGFVPRENHLINNLSVYQNIALPLSFHAYLKSSEIHKKVSDVIDFLNLGIVAGCRPYQLSMLIAKKVAVGRAMVNLPEFMLIDSAYVNLDTIAACQINHLIFHSVHKWIQEQRIIASLSPSITYLTLVNILFNVLEYINRAAMLYKGEFLFEGTPELLHASENPFVQQYVQARLEGPIKYEEV